MSRGDATNFMNEHKWEVVRFGFFWGRGETLQMQKISEIETLYEHLQRLYRKEFSVMVLQSAVKSLLTEALCDCIVSGNHE